MTRALMLGLAVLSLSTAALADDKAKKPATIPEKEKHPVDANLPKPTGTIMDLKVGDAMAKAYVARPTGEDHSEVRRSARIRELRVDGPREAANFHVNAHVCTVEHQ